jgi:hypothetical protein
VAEHPADDDGVSEEELRKFVADVERMVKAAAGEHEAEAVLSATASIVAEATVTPRAGGGVDRHIRVCGHGCGHGFDRHPGKAMVDPAAVGITPSACPG